MAAATGCGPATGDGKQTVAARPPLATPRTPGGAASRTQGSPSKPMAKAELDALLLTTSELGANYSEVPAESGGGDDNVGLQGCPELSKMFATSFAAQTARAFQYGYDSSSQVTETLFSDSPSRLSTVLGGAVRAMSSGRSFTFTSGTTPVQATVSQVHVPQLGDEQFGMTVTMVGPARTIVIEEEFVRMGSVAVSLTGAPGLVDNHLSQAAGKVRRHL